jgi:hypothetical protein
MAKYQITKGKIFEITAKRFKGFSELGLIKLPEEIAKVSGKMHLSWKEKPIVVSEELAALLNSDHFDKKEVTE